MRCKTRHAGSFRWMLGVQLRKSAHHAARPEEEGTITFKVLHTDGYGDVNPCLENISASYGELLATALNRMLRRTVLENQPLKTSGVFNGFYGKKTLSTAC